MMTHLSGVQNTYELNIVVDNFYFIMYRTTEPYLR